MRTDRRLALAMLAPGAALGLWLALGGLLLWATLEAEARVAVGAALGPLVASHGMLVVLWWLLAAALAAWAARRLYDAHVAEPARLADATRVLAGAAAAPDLSPSGGASTRGLVEAINALAAKRRALERELAQLVADASRNIAEQRDQLGALMAELNQSVVVCNLDGRILLYNERARRLFHRMSGASDGAASAELIGLGRSIHGAVDRALIGHALERVERRIASGGDSAGVSARFVTGTPTGHLLHVNLAPVRPSEASALTGFVLLLDDVTEDYAAETRRDRELLELVEASRASLASLQAALDVLEDPTLKAELRDRFQTVVRDEVSRMGSRLSGFVASASEDLSTRWPLQDMLGSDLLSATRIRIEAEFGHEAAIEAVDPTLWLSVDSYALIEALVFLAGRLVERFHRPDLTLRLSRSGGRARLDLIWTSPNADASFARDCQNEPMHRSGAGSPLTVRDIALRHGGELWTEHDHAAGVSIFRFLLPLASSEPTAAPAPAGSRPEYYDFDLFAGESDCALDERPLSGLTYTVFDTETTGLDPVGGDEIIQIGATRIVNGRLLRGECFDQLVDPQRSVTEASIQVHGIGPDMVRGKPTIVDVLPRFRAFVADTVLVGHNVAFDMRFLQLKEAASGARFDQPVLDTLLLSSVVHPNEASHSLEAVAARLGVALSDRHTALGDALAVAEIYLKLVPLLNQRGFLTLSQARSAARNSFYATLKY